jgi:hypothetical protein
MVKPPNPEKGVAFASCGEKDGKNPVTFCMRVGPDVLNVSVSPCRRDLILTAKEDKKRGQ